MREHMEKRKEIRDVRHIKKIINRDACFEQVRLVRDTKTMCSYMVESFILQ